MYSLREMIRGKSPIAKEVVHGEEMKTFQLSSEEYGQDATLQCIVCKEERKAAEFLKRGHYEKSNPHKHICECIEALIDRDPDGRFWVFLVFERGQTSLEDERKKQFSQQEHHFEESKLWKYLKTVVKVGAYLQREDLALRDIRPEKLLLVDGRLKIANMDRSRKMAVEGANFQTLEGAMTYMSPEQRIQAVSGQHTQHIKYDAFKSDVYSLGVTMLKLSCLEFKNDITDLGNLEQALEDNIEDVIEKKFSPQWVSVLKKMLAVKVSQRPDFFELENEVAMLAPPKTLDLVCIVDESGSMCGTPTRLIQDALRCLLDKLRPSDRMALVGFSDDPRVICSLYECFSENKATLCEGIDSLENRDTSNLTEGFQCALQILRNRESKRALTAVLILTDGEFPEVDLESMPIDAGLVVHCFKTGSENLALKTLTERGRGKYTEITSDTIAAAIATAFPFLTKRREAIQGESRA